MGNSKGIVKRLKIGTIDAAKFDLLKFKLFMKGGITFMNEELRRYKFNGNDTDYFVSRTGDIYSNKRSRMEKMSQTKTARGYVKVRLSMDGKVYNRNIHRMVAETFIPNPDNKPEVNHIDGNKKNNNVTNLEWTTRKENANHA